MKKFLWFIFGIAVGVGLTIAFSYFYNGTDMEFYDQPGQVMDESEYTVIQAYSNGTALASNDILAMSMGFGIVLLWNKEKTDYYDGQVVEAGKNQVFRQIGIYRYRTAQDNILKTVPIVELADK